MPGRDTVWAGGSGLIVNDLGYRRATPWFGKLDGWESFPQKSLFNPEIPIMYPWGSQWYPYFEKHPEGSLSKQSFLSCFQRTLTLPFYVSTGVLLLWQVLSDPSLIELAQT